MNTCIAFEINISRRCNQRTQRGNRAFLRKTIDRWKKKKCWRNAIYSVAITFPRVICSLYTQRHIFASSSRFDPYLLRIFFFFLLDATARILLERALSARLFLRASFGSCSASARAVLLRVRRYGALRWFEDDSLARICLGNVFRYFEDQFFVGFGYDFAGCKSYFVVFLEFRHGTMFYIPCA